MIKLVTLLAVGLFFLVVGAAPLVIEHRKRRFRERLQTFAQHGQRWRREVGVGVCPCSSCAGFRREAFRGYVRP